MEDKRLNYWYPFKVWLTTICITGPILSITYSMIKNNESIFIVYTYLYAILPIILIGLLFSIPTLLVSYLIYVLVGYKELKYYKLKFAFTIISAMGTVLTFYIITGENYKDFSFIYSISIAISSLFFRVYKPIKAKIQTHE